MRSEEILWTTARFSLTVAKFILNFVFSTTPSTQYNMLWDRLNNRLNNRMHRVNMHSTCCAFNLLSNRLYNRTDNRLNVCINDTIAVVQLVVKPAERPAASCKQTFSRLSNPSDNRLCRLNGVWCVRCGAMILVTFRCHRQLTHWHSSLRNNNILAAVKSAHTQKVKP